MEIKTSTDADFEQLLKDNEQVVVKYYAGWCGSCRLFAPKFKRLSNDERFTNVAFLDVDAEKNPVARKMANVDTLPFFATFKNGELVEATSTTKEDQVVSMIEKLQA